MKARLFALTTLLAASAYLTPAAYADGPEYYWEVPGDRVLPPRVVYVPYLVNIPQDWQSVEELAQFLEADSTDSHIILVANEDGIVYLTDFCEDWAIQLKDRAMKQGKYLALVPLNRNEYKKWYGEWPKPNEYHMIAGAIVGDNEFWYIEPSNDEHWLAFYLD